MVNKKIWLGILVMALVFGMTVVGCDNGSNDPANYNDKGEDLPAASGVNEVSGKTYYFSREKTDFAENGTYVVTTVDKGTYGPNSKYTYTTRIETGTYSWNNEAKTVTLKPEKIAELVGGGGGSLPPDGSETVYSEYGPLQDRTGYRSEIQAGIDEYRKEKGQAAVNQQLSSMGFSSVAAYLDYRVNEAFGNKSNGYYFSDDGTLFLEEALPANKGANELSGQTYYGMAYTWNNATNSGNYEKSTQMVYVFTASGYTFTDSRYGTQTQTGSYAYDSSRKQVWLNLKTINGKDRKAYYTDQTAPNGHHYPDDNACRAARTNSAFYLLYDQPMKYNSTDKTIGWED